MCKRASLCTLSVSGWPQLCHREPSGGALRACLACMCACGECAHQHVCLCMCVFMCDCIYECLYMSACVFAFVYTRTCMCARVTYMPLGHSVYDSSGEWLGEVSCRVPAISCLCRLLTLSSPVHVTLSGCRCARTSVYTGHARVSEGPFHPTLAIERKQKLRAALKRPSWQSLQVPGRVTALLGASSLTG